MLSRARILPGQKAACSFVISARAEASRVRTSRLNADCTNSSRVTACIYTSFQVRTASNLSASQNEPRLDLKDLVRQSMRFVKSPVAIITSTNCDIDPSGGPESWMGATVSSFNTVALNPFPLVSFNIHKESATLRAITTSRYFAVHLLAAEPGAAFLANLFAKPNSNSPFLDEDDMQQYYVLGRKWYMANNVKHGSVSARLSPRLQIWRHNKPPAVMTTMLCNCSRREFLSVGDHVIVVGRVVELAHGQDDRPQMLERIMRQNAEKRYPPVSLGYHNGRYDLGGRPPTPSSPFSRAPYISTSFRSVFSAGSETASTSDPDSTMSGSMAISETGTATPTSKHVPIDETTSEIDTHGNVDDEPLTSYESEKPPSTTK